MGVQHREDIVTNILSPNYVRSKCFMMTRIHVSYFRLNKCISKNVLLSIRRQQKLLEPKY